MRIVTAPVVNTISRRQALGMVNRSKSVGLTVSLAPGRVAVVRVPKTVIRRALRRLPLGSRVMAETVFDQFVLGGL